MWLYDIVVISFQLINVLPVLFLINSSAIKNNRFDANHIVGCILVGGFNPSEKYESQLGWLFPIYGNINKCSKPPTSISCHIPILFPFWSVWNPYSYAAHGETIPSRSSTVSIIVKSLPRGEKVPKLKSEKQLGVISGNIPTKYGLIWYSTSILGSWNDHWCYMFFINDLFVCRATCHVIREIVT